MQIFYPYDTQLNGMMNLQPLTSLMNLNLPACTDIGFQNINLNHRTEWQLNLHNQQNTVNTIKGIGNLIMSKAMSFVFYICMFFSSKIISYINNLYIFYINFKCNHPTVLLRIMQIFDLCGFCLFRLMCRSPNSKFCYSNLKFNLSKFNCCLKRKEQINDSENILKAKQDSDSENILKAKQDSDSENILNENQISDSENILNENQISDSKNILKTEQIDTPNGNFLKKEQIDTPNVNILKTEDTPNVNILSKISESNVFITSFIILSIIGMIK